MKNLNLTASQIESTFVCSECICDPDLAEFISKNASESQCNYCEKMSINLLSLPLRTVADHMSKFIRKDWTDPINVLQCDDNGYIGETFTGEEVFVKIKFRPRSQNLFNDLVPYFDGHKWCRADYFELRDSERYRYGWQDFCDEVKHVRRYTFGDSNDAEKPEVHTKYLRPEKMLDELHEIIKKLRLIRQIPEGTEYWRVREHEKSKPLNIPLQITSPPRHLATQPNRMSPSGIPMFYGAEDFNTAVREVVGGKIAPSKSVTGVKFKTMRNLNMLDLTCSQLKTVSYFCPNDQDYAVKADFFRFFAKEASKPIVSEESHNEYVPTQVFTEYIRFYVKSDTGEPMDGIRFFSSRNNRPCVVLFFDQDDCLKSRIFRPQSLAYVLDSKKTIDLDKPRR